MHQLCLEIEGGKLAPCGTRHRPRDCPRAGGLSAPCARSKQASKIVAEVSLIGQQDAHLTWWIST